MLAVSHLRETRPVGGPAGQLAYLNGACLLETDLGPHDVLGMLAAVENTLERERQERWGERTLDLDLLLYDDVVLDEAAVTVPHPRMTTRRFVLEPAAEIAGEWTHPLAGCSVAALLDNLAAPHPLVAVLGVPGSGATEIAAVVADAVMARAIHAPRPLPVAAAIDAYRETLAAWTRPLAAADWSADPHGTVVDFWIDMLPAAAHGRLAAAEAGWLAAEVDRAAAFVPAPQVAILLVASADTLEERIAFRGRPAAPHTDLFADLGAATVTLPPPAASAAALVEVQERLLRRLRSPDARGPRTPKAVVLVDAADLGRAADEAIAAVEAMI